MLLCLTVDVFIGFLAKNWSTLASAPLVFILTLAAAGGIAFALARWRYESIVKQRESSLEHKDGVVAQKDAIIAQKDASIATIGERLEHRDDQIKDLTAKVGTSSPDAIKARIDALESQVSQLKPRRLTPEQTSQLTTSLRSTRGHVRILHEGPVADARVLAGDLFLAFTSAGWTVEHGMIMGPGNPPPSGIGLSVSGPANLTAAQGEVARALKFANIPFDLRAVQLAPTLPGIQPDADTNAEIVVTQKVV